MGKGKPYDGFWNSCERGVNITNTQSIFKGLVKDMFENMLRIKNHFESNGTIVEECTNFRAHQNIEHCAMDRG